MKKSYVNKITLRPYKVWSRLLIGKFDPFQKDARLLKQKHYMKVGITIEAKTSTKQCRDPHKQKVFVKTAGCQYI